MLYQTRRLLVEAMELEEELQGEIEPEEGSEGTSEIVGVPGDWLVKKVGSDQWYLVPGPEFHEHYEAIPEDDVDLAALEELTKGRPEGGL